MIKKTSTLSCKFKNEAGKTRSINIDNPSQGATSEKISRFMEFVIANRMFSLDESDEQSPLALMSAAAITRKEVETIELVVSR